MATDQDTIKSYNNYAKKWAERLRGGKNIAHKYLEKPAMYGKLPNLANKSVLCIGCGTGEECDYISKQGAKKVVGIDISDGLIEFAQKSYPKINFYVMDMEKIDFPDFIF